MALVAQLTRTGTLRGDGETFARTRDAFARRHLVRIPSFIASDILGELARVVERCEFRRRVHSGAHGATDVRIEDPDVRWLLMFLMNDPQLFSVIRDLTGCDEIGFFNPSIYKMEPGEGHLDQWHDDAGVGNKLIGMSVNLGQLPFEGGVLQIRTTGTSAIIHSEQNTGFGDAMLFRIDASLEHFVTAVTGSVPRIALAGWFQRTPKYSEIAAGIFRLPTSRT
jgi:hypothetical protein